jgi:hypothetical protein
MVPSSFARCTRRSIVATARLYDGERVILDPERREAKRPGAVAGALSDNAAPLVGLEPI